MICRLKTRPFKSGQRVVSKLQSRLYFEKKTGLNPDYSGVPDVFTSRPRPLVLPVKGLIKGRNKKVTRRWVRRRRPRKLPPSPIYPPSSPFPIDSEVTESHTEKWVARKVSVGWCFKRPFRLISDRQGDCWEGSQGCSYDGDVLGSKDNHGRVRTSIEEPTPEETLLWGFDSRKETTRVEWISRGGSEKLGSVEDDSELNLKKVQSKSHYLTGFGKTGRHW